MLEKLMFWRPRKKYRDSVLGSAPALHNCRCYLEFRPQEATQQSVQRIGLLARISKWFGAIANR
jgi:hypothetical protein